MSVGAARLGDICSGHDGFPPRINLQGSPDTFINNKPAHRKNDAWNIHCNNTCHVGYLASGSPTVFVNNLPLGRKDDPINCGSVVASASSDVLVD